MKIMHPENCLAYSFLGTKIVKCVCAEQLAAYTNLPHPVQEIPE